MAKKKTSAPPPPSSSSSSTPSKAAPNGTSTTLNAYSNTSTSTTTTNTTEVTPLLKDHGDRHSSALQSTADPGSLSTTTSHPDLPDVKVNKWSQHELKTAVDDSVKLYYSQHYKQSHLHTDVHLALGWTSSIIALAASAYAWKVGFQASRQYTLYAVITFVALSTVLTIWQKYVEKDTVFQGARKIHASSRIEKQALHVRSNCLPYDPVYHMMISYRHSTNGGKTLLREADKDVKVPFTAVFDEDGKLVREELEKALKSAMDSAIGGP